MEVLFHIIVKLAYDLQVDIYESRPFIGGKVASFVDKRGNHIEMGLHVFFGCYSNLFRLMKKVKFFELQLHNANISVLRTNGISHYLQTTLTPPQTIEFIICTHLRKIT